MVGFALGSNDDWVPIIKIPGSVLRTTAKLFGCVFMSHNYAVISTRKYTAA